MVYSRLTAVVCCILALALFVGQAAAAPATINPQAGPVRGVANDLWADIVLGKPDFTGLAPYEVTGSRLFNPGGVIVDRSVTPNRMYVYDGGNSRILGLHINTQSGRSAELVLGQPGLDGYSGCNRDSNFQHYPQRAVASASTLCTLPESQVSPREGGSNANMAVDAQGNLYVPDFFNNRILLYNRPFDTDTIADDFWGQPNFSGNLCNGNLDGSFPNASKLCLLAHANIYGYTAGVSLDKSKNLWVADTGNHRVLRFPYDPTTGHAGHVANLVLGQPDFTTNLPGSTKNKMWTPEAVRVNAAGDVFVADSHNNRVLIFHPPFSNGMSATSTLGTNLRAPSSIEFDQNNNIWISDTGNNQLLRFTPAKVLDRVLFKDKPKYDGSCGGDYVPDGAAFYFPGTNDYENSANLCNSAGSIGIDSDGNIWVTASGAWQDLLRFPAPIPAPQTGIAHSADVRTFQAYGPNQVNAINERGLSDPRGIAMGAGQLIVSDGGRILFWNDAPTSITNGKPADGVIVAPNFNVAVNPPTGAIQVDGQNRLWVARADTISVYQLPLVTGATPFYTLQPPVAVREDIGWNPSLDVAGMIVTSNGDYLWLSDPDNHRVIRIADPLTNPVVDVVIGQLNAAGNECNLGMGYYKPARNSLCAPGGIAMDLDGNIYVADFALEVRGNKRLLEYDARLFPPHPASAIFGVPASHVYGTKGSFTEQGCLGSYIDPLCQPFAPAFNHSGQMVVGISGYSGDHFPLIYQNPLTNAMPVETLKDYYSMPSAVYYDSDDNLYVADRNRGRVLIYLADMKTISGNVGIAGASISYNDGRLKSITADKDGNYTLKVRTGWSGAITPSKPGYSFAPAHIDYANIASDQTNQNYSETRVAYFVSGHTGFAGITFHYTDGSAKTATTDSNGNYTILLPVGWSGTITPSGLGATFTPPNRVYQNLSADFVNQNYTVNLPFKTFRSIGAQDGWLLQYSENSKKGGSMNAPNTTLRVGDDNQRRQYMSMLSFNTSSLPDNATITNVTLKLKQDRSVGNKNLITVLGGLIFDMYLGPLNAPALELADFGSFTPNHYGPFISNPVGGFYSFDLTKGKATINKLANKDGLTQINIRFKVSDNNDNIADYLSLFSGNAPTLTDRPQLIVTYYVP